MANVNSEKKTDFKSLFSTLDIGNRTVKNRIVVSAHATGFETDGILSDRHVRYLKRMAVGGAGLIMTFGSASVYKESSASYGSIDLWNPKNEPRLRELAEHAHEHGALIMSQATHMGRRGDSALSGRPLQAPSAVPEGVHREIPHVLRTEDIPPIVDAFAEAAARLERCGWDGIEITSFGGHLIEQFWSPTINDRTDRYGGDLEGRMRFSVEVVEAVAKAVSDDFIIGFRMTGNPLTDKLGLDKDDMIEIAKELDELGHIDMFNIAGGTKVDMIVQAAGVPGDTFKRGTYVEDARRMKEHLSVPVLVAGRILDPDQADEALNQGNSDLVAMTRAIMADPELPRKAEEGRVSQIRPDIALTEDSIGRLYSGRPIVCAVNPAVADDSLAHFEKAKNKRRVVVIGGGPAGMEAARVAAERGHEVILLEAAEHLGGQVATGTAASERPHFGRHIKWLERELKRFHVDVQLNEKAGVEEILNLNPDAVILATGSNAEIPPEVKGITARCTTDVELLDGQISISPDSRVLVYDREGKFRGASIAKFAAEAGASQVEIVTPLWSVSEDLDQMQKPRLYLLLAKNNVILTPNQTLVGQKNQNFLLEEVWSGRERVVEDVDVIVFVGYQKAQDELYEQLLKASPNLDVHLIGDSIAPRKLSDAVAEGVRIGSIL
ncbi:oxidoreductase [Oceanobacillus locisalsi]|uniref:FAD-dependent oxidoreductase n=1 Tax=Oceanobacillus locisalsi TaxID=546107 RepID=A0ABW3NGN0_9BACI